jgi:pimeloyl-ACP methyl ester carboxylesterase
MNIKWSSATDTNGYPTREFSLEGNRSVTGAVWLPDEPTLGATLICFGHGASGDRYQDPIADLAARFVQAGFPCLSIDGPVHGLRKVGDGARGAFFPEYQRENSIADMVSDWEFAIEAAKALNEIGACELAYFGLSMGSIFGIPLVAARPDVVVATLGLVGVSGQFPHGKRILEAATDIRCPTLFLMQLEDELFDREGYLKVFDAFSAKDKRLHANPGLHAEVPIEEVDYTFRFMHDVLTRAY